MSTPLQIRKLYEKIPVELWIKISNELEPEDVLFLGRVGIFARPFPPSFELSMTLILDVSRFLSNAILQVNLGDNPRFSLSQAQAIPTVLSC